jgi:hypothetical protein
MQLQQLRAMAVQAQRHQFRERRSHTLAVVVVLLEDTPLVQAVQAVVVMVVRGMETVLLVQPTEVAVAVVLQLMVMAQTMQVVQVVQE